MTDAPSAPAGERIVVPPGHGSSSGGCCAGTLSRITQRLDIRIPEPLSRSIKTQFSIRKSAPKHVPLIFAASVCATLGGSWWGISHMVALGDMVMFYGQWREILGYNDAKFFDMSRRSGSKAARQQTFWSR